MDEASQHLRLVIEQLDSVLNDPDIAGPTFTLVLHARDDLDAHLRAAAVLHELGAITGARRVLTDATRDLLTHSLTG